MHHICSLCPFFRHLSGSCSSCGYHGRLVEGVNIHDNGLAVDCNHWTVQLSIHLGSLAKEAKRQRTTTCCSTSILSASQSHPRGLATPPRDMAALAEKRHLRSKDILWYVFSALSHLPWWGTGGPTERRTDRQFQPLNWSMIIRPHTTYWSVRRALQPHGTCTWCVVYRD